MVTEAEVAAVAFDTRPRLDHRGVPLETDEQHWEKNKAWIDHIGQDAVAALTARYYYGGVYGSKTVLGRVVSKNHGSFNVCFFVELEVSVHHDEGGDETSQPKAVAKWVVYIPIPRVHAYGRGYQLLKAESTAETAVNTVTDELAQMTVDDSTDRPGRVHGKPRSPSWAPRRESSDQGSKRAGSSTLSSKRSSLTKPKHLRSEQS